MTEWLSTHILGDYLFLAKKKKLKKSNLVTFNTQVKKEHFLCDLFSQKGDLVENSFGPGKKAVLSFIPQNVQSAGICFIINIELYDHAE